MRTWGRRNGQWVIVETAADGSNDAVYITTLIQVLKLNLNESPYYSRHGIPAQPSVIQQVAPDFYIQFTQQQFAPYFASLIVSKVKAIEPTYKINVMTNQGVRIEETVAT